MYGSLLIPVNMLSENNKLYGHSEARSVRGSFYRRITTGVHMKNICLVTEHLEHTENYRKEVAQSRPKG